MQKFIVLSVLISACLSRAFRHSYFRSCKCKTRDTVPRTTLLCLYTSCLIITDNWWMRKFAGYSVCKVPLVYVLPSSTPPLVTRFFHWLCSDFVPFLLTKCLVCFAELNLYCFTRRNHWSGERIQAKEAQECHWLDFSQLLLRNPVLLEVSQRNSAKEKKPRLTINCWGESLCSLVNPLVDSHPPIHSDMVKTPVNKCRFSLPTSE